MYPNNNCNDCPECPGAITPLPLPDLSGLCGDEYPAACVIYTGENINCLGITSGMTFLEILNIFNIALTACNCCVPVDCVIQWGPWGPCECYYDETETLICGRQTSIGTIITPPSNGGAPCGPLIKYRPCTVSSMCFTFGSDICETAPLGTQIIVAPSGIYDDKTYYSFTICGNPQSVWWSNLDDKWHISPSLGVADVPDFTLDNNDDYYPVSNTTTYLWNNPSDDTNTLDLLQSTLDTCPTYLVCFHLQLTIDTRVYNFFNSVAPTNTPFDTGDHPFYSYFVSDGTTSYSVIIVYDPTSNLWTARVDGVIIGTLTSTTFYPYGTWVANPLNPTSYIVSATLGGTCVQPPGVDCVLECGPWSDCIGGTQTRTCTVVTPPSGNGAPCDPLLQTQICVVPYCFPPILNSVTETDEGVIPPNVIVDFTGVSGALNYTIVYTIGGVAQPAITVTSSPFLLPHVCGSAYVGTIVTNCTNLLTSSQVPFSFTTREASFLYKNERFNNLLINNDHSFNPTGDVLYITVHNSGTVPPSLGNDRLVAYNLGTAWNVSTIITPPFAQSLTFNQEGSTQAYGHCFGDNGFMLYVCSYNANKIIRYVLSVAWDITTATFTPGDFYNTPTVQPMSIEFSNDGYKMFVSHSVSLPNINPVIAYSLTVPWVINTGVSAITQIAPNNWRVFGLSFQDNGNLLFYITGITILGVTHPYLVKRTLSTPYDISPVSISAATVIDLDPMIQPGQNLFGLSFENGYKGFISGYAGNAPGIIRAFELTCEYELGDIVLITP